MLLHMIRRWHNSDPLRLTHFADGINRFLMKMNSSFHCQSSSLNHRYHRYRHLFSSFLPWTPCACSLSFRYHLPGYDRDHRGLGHGHDSADCDCDCDHDCGHDCGLCHVGLDLVSSIFSHRHYRHVVHAICPEFRFCRDCHCVCAFLDDHDPCCGCLGRHDLGFFLDLCLVQNPSDGDVYCTLLLHRDQGKREQVSLALENSHLRQGFLPFF
mmetsp:Transcript_26345/g.36769  ORF Transcript_26345/g.36769 Transcript_26345/m.36769 type:complete len:212 (+) Transcript_26345:52-687(+)